MLRRNFRRIALLATLAVCGPLELVHAQGQRLRDMAHASWRERDGAPWGITHLAQGSDGSLWIGSESGLVNFDGQTFRPVQSPPGEPGLPADKVYSLLITTTGTIWVSFEKLIARVAADDVTLYDTADASPLGSVEQLTEALDGSVWAIDGRRRLIRFVSDGQWRAEPTPSSGLIAGLFVDSSNTLWLAQDGFLHTRAPHQAGYVQTEVRASVVTGFAETPNRSIWMSDYDATTARARLQQISPTGGLIRTHPQGLPNSGTLVSTADGSLIITPTFAGIRRLSAEELYAPTHVRARAEPDTLTTTQGLTSRSARAVIVDSHGNIWIGGAFGLDRLSPNRLARVLPEEAKGMWGMCATARGDTLLVNSVGEMYFVSGHAPTRLGVAADLVSFACADVGRVWFVDKRGGIWSIVAGRITALPSIEGTRQGDFIKIVAAPDHTLYATVAGRSEQGGGVWRYRDHRWTKLGGGELSAGGFSAYVDHRDRLWIGYTEGRAILHEANDARMFQSSQPGLGTVHSFLDTSHGMIAAGTNGLAVLRDSRFEMLAYAEPSLVRGVRGMVEARNGDLWMNSANGLACLTAKELRAGIADPTYPMKVRLVREGDFAAASGSHSVKVTYWQNVARDSQGYLWFSILGIGAKDGEIVRLDPENSHATNHAPKVSIRSFVANGQPLTSDRRLAPSTRAVSVQYFGVNLTAPNSVIYRYRLEGFDESWQEAGRRTEAVYTSLPPGTYSFAVMASSGDGIWTDPVSSAPITVLPRFYQTWWFAAAMAGLVMLIAGVAHRVRVRQISRVMSARFDERLAERTRVARELHDTLLQTVHGSKLVVERALRDNADRDRLVRALEQLSVWLGQAAAEGRAALHSLRASTTEGNDLAGAFRRAIDECRNDSAAQTPFCVQGHARELHPMVRDEVYRIGYEAIRNACMHSSANRIDIALEYGHDVILRISDDGVGIDTAVIETGKEGHFGLRGMRERAERIGATFTLVSGPGIGTAITLIVPGRIAFRSA